MCGGICNISKEGGRILRAREATFVQEAAIISETQHEEIVSVIVAELGMNGTPLNYKG